MGKSKVVVHVEGGVVQSVSSDDLDIEVIVIDCDVSGFSDAEIDQTPCGEAIVSSMPVTQLMEKW